MQRNSGLQEPPMPGVLVRGVEHTMRWGCGVIGTKAEEDPAIKLVSQLGRPLWL